MAWAWHWWLFVVATVVCTIFIQFSRGYFNAANIAQYGDRADWRQNRASAFIGSIGAGAIYAAVITAILGFLF